MPSDFLYPNAPLAEVIAEVFWELTPLTAIPGASVDPPFPVTSSRFQQLVARQGFTNVERLIPQDVPLELVAGQPLFRYRKNPEAWPLYQLGPGVFSCNIVPPYQGWADFQEVIASGLSALVDAFPSAEHQFRTTLTSLRYLDVFTEKHGFLGNVSAFLRDYLGIQLKLPDSLLTGLASPAENVVPTIEARIQVDQTEQFLVLKAQQGTSNGAEAVVMELRVSSTMRLPPSAKELSAWFNAAHGDQHQIFDRLATEELKGRMGPKNEVGAS